jgi:hypothetical protein
MFGGNYWHVCNAVYALEFASLTRLAPMLCVTSVGTVRPPSSHYSPPQCIHALALIPRLESRARSTAVASHWLQQAKLLLLYAMDRALPCLGHPARKHITSGHKLTRMGFSAKKGSQLVAALSASPQGHGQTSRFGIISFSKVNSPLVFPVFRFPAALRVFVEFFLVLLFVRSPSRQEK